MSYIFRIKVAASGLCIAILSACSSVPITSYPKLASMNPETMDMREIEIAVRLQDDFGITEDSVVIDVSLVHEETGELIQEQFILEQSPEPLTSALERKLKQGYDIHRFRMSRDTGEAITAYRDQIINLRNAEPGDQHEGTFSASAGICRNEGANPFLVPRMTLLIRTSPEDDFFTMFKETKVPLPVDETGQQKACVTAANTPN